MRWINADSHTASDIGLIPRDHEWLSNQIDHLLRDQRGIAFFVDIIQQNHELVPAQARYGIRLAHACTQTLGDSLQILAAISLVIYLESLVLAWLR